MIHVLVVLVKNIRSVVEIDLQELRVQIALGTVSEEVRENIWKITDVDALELLGDASDEYIRRAVAVNPYTPDEVLEEMYHNDPAPIVKDMAWEMIDRRCEAKGEISPPRPIEDDGDKFDDLPPNTQIYRS